MVIQLADHPEISDCGVTKGTGQYPAVNGTDDVDLNFLSSETCSYLKKVPPKFGILA